MSVIEITVERISQDISCEKEVVVLEVIDNHQPSVISVVQSVGESQSAVMSQKAVTDELTSLATLITDNESSSQERVNALSIELQEEIQDRVAADNALSSTLQDEVQNRADSVHALSVELQEEIQDRVAADNALSSTLQEETQDRVAADNALSSEIQRIQQEYDQALLDLKAQMESDLSSLRSELLQHLRYSMYLDLPMGGTK